ncbi:hypothetical protein DSM112329_00813 [Paraconexibacter sp. AEG42_29]|uniref:Glycosyltransferase 2-like domain-containing protein n=1 Tax=Paraconexibacter sp. AEG42_29 TaxID=2997339 RepID=A0AAU7AQR8_9ACTN
MRRLIISPGPGVALRSASHGLDAGTTVVSVFAGPPSEAGPAERLAMVAEVARDRAALLRADAECLYFAFADPVPASTVVQVAWALNRIAHDFDEIWLPAGIGDRRHSVTAEAALRLRGSFRRVMYAEHPDAAALWQDAPTLKSVLAATRFAPPRVPDHERCQAAEHEWTWDLPAAPASPPTVALLPRPAAGREGGVFLSVLMRTRGDRPEQLRHALASLVEQTSRDFELLLLPHDCSPDAVAAEVDALPDWLRERTRTVPVAGGKRATPLNAGVRAARGRYFVALDDDDEALPHWVQTFADLEAATPGRVLRTGVAFVHLDGSRPDVTLPADFDLVGHLSESLSAFLGLAFPLDRLDGGELRFDETLDVCEDWDYLLRAAQLFGVANTPVVTARYLRWPDVANSFGGYPAPTWQASWRQVHDATDASFLLLPPGSAVDLRRLYAAVHDAEAELEALRAAAGPPE